MSGKIYVGSPNGVVARAKDVVVGDSNNVAHRAKGVFVGNSSDKAVKIWPASVLPIGYQEVEWLEVPAYIRGTTVGARSAYDMITYIKSTMFPRMELSFEFTEDIDSNGIYGIFSCENNISKDTGDGWLGRGALFYDFAIKSNRFIIMFGYAPNQEYVSTHDFDRIYSTDSEEILTNTRYTLIYNQKQNNLSRFYLYNTEGYYSIPRNNLLGSSSKNVINTTYTDETSYIKVCGYTAGFYGDDPLHQGDYRLFSPPKGFRLYYCKMYDQNNNLIRDFIPAYRKSDEKTGFYDMVDKIFIESNTQLTPGPIV